MGKIPELVEHLIDRAEEMAELFRKKSIELDAIIQRLRNAVDQ